MKQLALYPTCLGLLASASFAQVVSVPLTVMVEEPVPLAQLLTVVVVEPIALPQLLTVVTFNENPVSLRGLTTLFVCFGDFNEDGGINGEDVEEFFRAWVEGDLVADGNGDGGVDGADIEAFFVVWERGSCP